MRLSFLSDTHHDGGTAGHKGGMQQLQHCSQATIAASAYFVQQTDTSNKHYITGRSFFTHIICPFLLPAAS